MGYIYIEVPIGKIKFKSIILFLFEIFMHINYIYYSLIYGKIFLLSKIGDITSGELSNYSDE